MGYWDQVRTVQRRRSIDPGTIAAASVRLLDESGLAGFTLRGLAGALGVAPASLYSRLDGLADAHDLALDDALARDADVRQAVDGAGQVRQAVDGAGEVRELALALYRHLLRHPWAIHVLAARPPRGPAYLALSEELVRRLRSSGRGDPLALAYAVSNLVLGSALTAGAARTEPTTPVDDDAAPTYARHHDRAAVDPEAVLDAALRALLAAPDAGRAAATST
ncbi:TetR/AcrR family transcriptional regulator [Georgenia sp. Z1491]|uniref:TetR/AcrR family transcriptional regulator n=1 Tax=Georgenia sp. Z1491 TaxID=3416707 RepID=UPI003CF0F4C8